MKKDQLHGPNKKVICSSLDFTRYRQMVSMAIINNSISILNEYNYMWLIALHRRRLLNVKLPACQILQTWDKRLANIEEKNWSKYLKENNEIQKYFERENIACSPIFQTWDKRLGKYWKHSCSTRICLKIFSEWMKISLNQKYWFLFICT